MATTEPESESTPAPEPAVGGRGYPKRCCGETFFGDLTYVVHRTEVHKTPMSALNNLEPGEFEQIVAAADTVADVADAFEWGQARTLRMLGIYGYDESVPAVPGGGRGVE